MGKKVTIQDIARLAGVSKSTVSRSLNDSPLISEETREMVKKIAKEQNFEFHASARGLSLNKVDSIGVIVPDDSFDSMTFLNVLMEMISRAFEDYCLDGIISFPLNSQTGESNIQRLIRTRKVSGLLILHPGISFADWQFLKEHNVPFVVVHFRPTNTSYKNFNYYFVEHEKGGFLATEMLIKAGKKRIMTITEGKGQLQFIDRTAGYEEALRHYGLKKPDHFLIEGECTYNFGYQAIKDRKNLLGKIDGIFVQADIIAAGVMNALHDLGIRIPEDIAVVGYDDIYFSEFLRPSLSTIHQRKEEMVEMACHRLREMLAGERPDAIEQMVLTPTPIYRNSCPR